ncbi:MAG: peptidylprolyl isomerase [Gemmatimonadales bacterium]|jgi:peptidyl-prolyl cis-trans isomerase SurA
MTVRPAAVVWALAFLAAPALLRAQQRPPVPVRVIDRVVAVVGDRPILLSEVEEKMLLAQSGGARIPADSAGREAMRRQTLEQMVNEEVLYQKARQDTAITVTDADVQNAVDEQVTRVRGQFQTETEFRNQLATAGFNTPEEYRRWLSDEQRRSAYTQRYLEKLRGEGKLRNASVSDAEIRRAFADAQAQAPNQLRPASVAFRQIVVKPEPTPAQRAAAMARAESALAEVRRGTDFSVVARRLSDDPGSKERGGDLGWFRRGQMVDSFERVAFRMRPGQISDIVTSPFGYHIILVDRVQPGEIKARHILITPVLTSRELTAARTIADTVAARLRAGANFDSLYTLFADTVEQKVVGPLARTQIPPVYGSVLEGAAVGDITPVFALAAEDSLHTKYVVVKVDDVSPERPYTYEEVRDQVRTNLQREKAVTELLRSLRRQTYVDIRY